MEDFQIVLKLAAPLFEEPITLCLFLLFLTWAGIRDIQTLKIRNKLNIMFFATAVVLMLSPLLSKTMGVDLPMLRFGWENIAGFILGFLFLFIPAFVKHHPMGGDIKISAVVGFWLGYEAMTIVLLLATLLNLAYWTGAFYIWKDYGSKTLMPFAPFIALGALVFYGFAYLA